MDVGKATPRTEQNLPSIDDAAKAKPRPRKEETYIKEPEHSSAIPRSKIIPEETKGHRVRNLA